VVECFAGVSDKKRLRLSKGLDECKSRPLVGSSAKTIWAPPTRPRASVTRRFCPPLMPRTRGSHSFTSQLDLSACYGIGGPRRGCVARVKGVLGGVQGVEGIFCVSDTAQVELKSERV